jgi:hypothetical protein
MHRFPLPFLHPSIHPSTYQQHQTNKTHQGTIAAVDPTNREESVMGGRLTYAINVHKYAARSFYFIFI